MKLGILETGAPPERLIPRFGTYGAMFRALLGEEANAYRSYDVAAGVLPKSAAECDAWLVTGSSAGVYDPLPWIAPLEDFLRAAKGQAPIVGVCFGHQVMAQAFGGRAEKSERGWGVGLHTYQVTAHPGWADASPTIAAPASHQDQVTVVPPNARVIGGNAHCPNGFIVYDDQPAISIQLHPEFDPAYAAALIEARRGARYTDAQADAAVASLRAPNDRARLGGWIEKFLRR